MALASFPLVIKRWSRSKLHYGDYAQYSHLREYVAEDVFITRLESIERHVLAEFPQVWIETYLFILAIALVALAAAISIVARATDLSVWYPLLILIAPAIIAFYTTRRRNTYYGRLGQSLLKEINSQDVTRQIKWSFRRPRDTDTALSLINTENELAREGEALPAYDTSMMDIVLDMGPNTHEPRLSAPAHPLPPAYDPSPIEMRAVQQPPPIYPATTS